MEATPKHPNASAFSGRSPAPGALGVHFDEVKRASFLGGFWRVAVGGALAACAVGCERSGAPASEMEGCPPEVSVKGPLLRDPSPLLGVDQDGVCRIDVEGRLSPSCLPRCSLAVRPAFYACRGPGCEEEVIATDSTAAISALSATNPAVSLELRCAGCIQKARSLCLARACPLELAAREACYASGQPSGCVPENAAFNACFLNHQHVYEPCLFLAEESCFPSSP